MISEPVFQVFEPNNKVYKVFADGRTEGFDQESSIVNGVLPLLHYAISLLRLSQKGERITDEQIARLQP